MQHDRKERTDSERLAIIENAVLETSHRLFGNGQPGLLATLELRLRVLEQVVPADFAKRLRMLEMGVIIALILASGMKLLEFWHFV